MLCCYFQKGLSDKRIIYSIKSFFLESILLYDLLQATWYEVNWHMSSSYTNLWSAAYKTVVS